MRNFYKVETADERLRVRSRSLVYAYCTVPHRRLDARLVSEPSATRISGPRTRIT
jgi:hypothetical protein